MVYFHHAGDVYEDTEFGDYLLCVLTLNGNQQLLSTPRVNLENGILTFYALLPRLHSFFNPLESESVVKVGHVNEDLSGKLKKKDILIDLPEGFSRQYSLKKRD